MVKSESVGGRLVHHFLDGQNLVDDTQKLQRILLAEAFKQLSAKYYLYE